MLRPLVIACAVLAVLFAWLGLWQVERAAWKRDFLVEWTAARAARAQPLAAELRAATSALRNVAGRGRYDPGATVLLDNQRVDGRVGVVVYTLLREEESGRGVLVDRGFVPLGADRVPPAVEAPPAGTTEVRGLLRPPPSIGLRMGNAAWTRGAAPPLLAYLDTEALGAAMGVALDPRVLVPAERAAQALPNTMPPERHVGYAVQWFALSATAVVIALVLMRRPA